MCLALEHQQSLPGSHAFLTPFVTCLLQFGLSLVTAGGLGGLFGLMNFFTRASGGLLSDVAAARFGMRGRLWCLFTIQLLGGVTCLILVCGGQLWVGGCLPVRPCVPDAAQTPGHQARKTRHNNICLTWFLPGDRELRTQSMQ